LPPHVPVPVQASLIVALPLLVTLIVVPANDTLPVAAVVAGDVVVVDVVLLVDGVLEPPPLAPPGEPPPVPPPELVPSLAPIGSTWYKPSA